MFHDYFAGSNLLVWPIVGLLLFVASFAAILLHVSVNLRDRRAVEHLASLPLDAGDELLIGDDAPATHPDAEREGKEN
ncbi:MAG: hypothetical protein R3C71_05525 [Candidatus Krumholzibacteriia bacterium]|nr:hypothetical protein [bacterium]MCB9513066.1 hypothetical protein [Candidatus Latescibacterota bacterium]MCB9516274.1 hypothetical protein [Candidatus Latescibacterota bacterium]